MSARSWIEFKGREKIAIFAVTTAIALMFCVFLPSEAWTRMGNSHGRSLPIPPLPFVMLFLWIGGWFTLLFLRVEDLNIMLTNDYQRLYRWSSAAVVFVGLCLAGLLYLRYLAI